MSRHIHTLDSDEYVVERPRSRGWLGWLLFVLLLAGAGAFVWYVHLPLRRERAALDQQLQDEGAKNQRAAQKLKEAETQLSDLSRTKAELAGQLEQTVQEKERLEAELKKVQGELSAKLEPEIQAGDVRIVRRGNDLVVDLSDKILFDSGKTEIHESGQKVLGQVAPTLASLTEYNIQVAGHTDSTRVVSPATQERYPTNWELSTARATNVVRFLEEQGQVPGERLVAMGFSQFRPVHANDTAKGRQLNRRIELILARK